jgi:hypothetical protein
MDTELGIIFFLLIYGALQERIMTRPYHGQVPRERSRAEMGQ